MKRPKISMRPMTKKQEAEAKSLKLNGYDWRWYDAIRRTGIEGARWGDLPMHISQRLHEANLVYTIGMTTWARGHGPGAS